MSFITVDKDRLKKRGSVFVIETENGLYVGRTNGDSKPMALMIAAEALMDNKGIPKLTLIRFKKSRDTYRDEALMHSYLYEYRTPAGLYKVSMHGLKEIWGLL